MFLMRPAGPDDLAAILVLAQYLDSPNLPADEGFLSARLERSEVSFARLGPPCAEREYQFALEDETKGVVGTCVILAKHGTVQMPHLFLRVREEERRSKSVGVCVKHVTLQLGASRDGPTELGALILHPGPSRSSRAAGQAALVGSLRVHRPPPRSLRGNGTGRDASGHRRTGPERVLGRLRPPLHWNVLRRCRSAECDREELHPGPVPRYAVLRGPAGRASSERARPRCTMRPFQLCACWRRRGCAGSAR